MRSCALHRSTFPAGITPQSHYNPPPQAAAALNPVNQAQALYAAASQMMIGNMMMDHLSSNKRRSKKRSGSPKRRMRSRSESPQRNKRARDSKRRRNKSPNYKPRYKRGSTSPHKSQKREEKKSEEMKKEETMQEDKEETLHQPPTPEDNVVAADTETENDEGSKTPNYKAEDDTPKTPEYDANTGSAITPPNSTSQQDVLTSRDMTSSTNLLDSVTSTHPTKTVVSVKPTLSLSPKMISLKKIRDTPDISSPAPDVGVKSLADILREQALKSMKRKPTPERESESERNSARDNVPETESLRTRAESPTLDRSTTESAKLARPFDDIDGNLFKPENNFNSDEDDFYSDDEFDPKKYARNSEDELLASPDRKNDLTGITMNFTVTPKMSKEEKKKAKLLKKKAREMKKQRKEVKKLKKKIKKQKAEEAESAAIQNSTDKANPAWQRKMISSHLGGEITPNTISPHSSAPSTPDEDEAEFLKTPEKCENIFFESVPTPTAEEPKPKKKSKRKVVVINKDPSSTSLQIPSPERKPEVDHSSIATKQQQPPAPAAVFGATIRSLVQPKAEQINTVSTTANRPVKGFNPFAPANLQPAPPKPTPLVTACTKPPGSFGNPLIKPDTTRKVPAENKPTRRLGGVKTIKIKKATSATPSTSTSTAAASSSAAVTLDQRLTQSKPAGKPAAVPPTKSIDDELDDSDTELDKELELLNAVMVEEPTTSRPNTKTDTLDDDDDLFADIEEFLNEERRNL